MTLTREQIKAIFMRSHLYGFPYRGDELPVYKYEWPKSTWMRKRLAVLRFKGEGQSNNREGL